MSAEIQKIVNTLGMKPHPEGGFYKETYRSTGVIPKEALLTKFSGARNYSTAIYFLLTSDNFSAFHKIKQDEIWHYYQGSSLNVHVIDENGTYTKYRVGVDLDKGELPQLVVSAGCWFASSVASNDGYSLVGCTVAPGFDFDDFQLAKRKNLITQFPEYEDVITKFTRT
ncbi:cupin domain-containing protein [Aquimarina pacifica]|uniref:cupin domain-containing protein n=1 Tax=Aquimarina pacifica TaxID=1296415 RepID=UPI00046EBFA6|nr:cupin domain-containing protein [Aquimarina pacifica]